jgi:hypothetical protein
MLVWRGYGIFVAILTVVAYIAATAAAEHIWSSPLSPSVRPGVELAGMLFAAALVYGLHLLVERSNKPRVLVDQSTGQEVVLQSKHDFFYLPIKYWPFVLAALGIWFFFQH